MRFLPHLFAAALALAVQAETLPPAKVVEAFHAALSDGEQAKAEALLLPEVRIYESGHVEATRAEYAAHHLPEDIVYARKSKTSLKRLDTVESPDMAVVTSESETLDLSGKQPKRYAGTETMVLKRVGGEWRIAHIHWSSHLLKK
ncbi:nuclear transport factor 2 family protein [Chitinimonas sp.]|uniref:YybH family protein n=1 Tax=Chitinimonas sp. TaxID=1934313 RepID=UPI002F93C930